MAEYLIKDTTLTEIANAIRNKSEKTDLIAVSNMANEINNISSTGALNFDVKGYNTEEALLMDKPAENTIGIITTNPITSWVVSSMEPSNITEGMVWLCTTDETTTIEFNGLKENGIYIHLASAKQYISGTFIDVQIKCFINNAWKGTEFIIIPDTTRTWSTRKCSVNQSESSTILTHNSYSDTNSQNINPTYAYTEFDVTGYNTLYIRYKFYGKNNGGSVHNWYFQLTDTSLSTITTLKNLNTSGGSTLSESLYENTVDISNISGKCRIYSTINNWCSDSSKYYLTIESCKLY